jgi:predicted nucleic acid-binding protein
MRRVVLLDTGVLGMLTHPRTNPGIRSWFQGLRQAGIDVALPEIADYELRRELLRVEKSTGKSEGLQRLDKLKDRLEVVRIRPDVMLLAAELWAEARSKGYATASDEALDGDVILAAQAILLSHTGDRVEVATENVGHLGHFTDAKKWTEIP